MVEDIEYRIDDHNTGKIDSIPINRLFKELERKTFYERLQNGRRD
jgi:hypothetical protein